MTVSESICVKNNPNKYEQPLNETLTLNSAEKSISLDEVTGCIEIMNAIQILLFKISDKNSVPIFNLLSCHCNHLSCHLLSLERLVQCYSCILCVYILVNRKKWVDQMKIKWIFYEEARRNWYEVILLFNSPCPGNSIDVEYLRRLVEKFTTTFSVKDTPRSGRTLVTPEDVLVVVLRQFAVNLVSSKSSPSSGN